MAGLAWLYRRDRSLATILGLAFLGQAFILGSWHNWWLGDAFGGRAFINCTLIFVLGLAILLDALKTRFPSVVLWAMAIVFLLWNGLFLIQYRFGFIAMDEALTWRQLFLDKLALPGQALKRLRQ